MYFNAAGDAVPALGLRLHRHLNSAGDAVLAGALGLHRFTY